MKTEAQRYFEIVEGCLNQHTSLIHDKGLFVKTKDRFWESDGKYFYEFEIAFYKGEHYADHYEELVLENSVFLVTIDIFKTYICQEILEIINSL